MEAEADGAPKKATGEDAAARGGLRGAGVAGCEEEEDKMCRYCFEGEEAGELIAPCRCAGGQKWVHLACLRRWQRGVLVSQPTHPDFYDDDLRHKLCNVCKSEFTCKPPTRLELMQSFTGEELAALVEERCIIGSHRDFSEELRRQVHLFPEPLREGIVDRHWIDGAFLIVKVVEDGGTPLVVRIDDQESIAEFARGITDDWCWQVRGRPYRLLFQGALEAAGRCADPAARREALQALQAPVSLRMQPADGGDCGEDGIVAVNLTRPVRVTGNPAELKRRRRFEAALQRALPEGEVLLPPVAHFLGGPCHKDTPQFAIVISDPGDYQVYAGLPQALQAAQERHRALRGTHSGTGAEAVEDAERLPASAEGATEEPPAKRPRCDPCLAEAAADAVKIKVPQPDIHTASAEAASAGPLAPQPDSGRGKEAPDVVWQWRDGRALSRGCPGAAAAEAAASPLQAASAAPLAPRPDAPEAPAAVAASDPPQPAASSQPSEPPPAAPQAAAAATGSEQDLLLSAAAAGGAAALERAAEQQRELEREVTARAEELRQEEELQREEERCKRDGGPPCRVLVFWGTAGWSRCQLMGELASGAWGLCKSEPADVTQRQPHELYEAVYPRLVFAPKTEMSETYNHLSAQTDAEEEAQARLLRLRRQLRRRQLQLAQERALLMERLAVREASGETSPLEVALREELPELLGLPRDTVQAPPPTPAQTEEDSSEDDNEDTDEDDDTDSDEGEEEEAEEGEEEEALP